MSTLKRKIKQISCPVAIFLMFLVISTLCHFRFLGENGYMFLIPSNQSDSTVQMLTIMVS